MPEHTLRPRRRFREFGDRPWVTGWIGEAYRDCLNLALKLAGQYRGMYRPFLEWARAAGGGAVLDLASGGGGPIETLIREAGAAGVRLPRIILSDIAPETGRYQALTREYGEDKLGYIEEPVAAQRPPVEWPRLRCICSAFHHLDPSDARELIRTTANSADGVFIMEPFPRDIRHLALMVLSGPFPYMLAPFTAPRFSLVKLLFCTLLPVIPVLVMIDACISVMNVYTTDEILAMFPDRDREEFRFESGECGYLRFFRATYFYAARRAGAGDRT